MSEKREYTEVIKEIPVDNQEEIIKLKNIIQNLEKDKEQLQKQHDDYLKDLIKKKRKLLLECSAMVNSKNTFETGLYQ